MTDKSFDEQVEELSAQIDDFKRGLDDERAEKFMQAFVDDGLISGFKKTKPRSFRSTVDRIVADAVREGQAYTTAEIERIEAEKQERYDNWY